MFPTSMVAIWPRVHMSARPQTMADDLSGVPTPDHLLQPHAGSDQTPGQGLSPSASLS